MTKQRIKFFINLLVSFGLAGLLFYLSYDTIETAPGQSKSDYIWSLWQETNKLPLFLSGGLILLSHMIRAERWKLLNAPLNYKISFSNSYHSVMSGYIVNLLIPRGGELYRCYMLNKLEKVPVNVSIGTVIAERAADLVFLLLLIGTSFFIEFEKLLFFIKESKILEYVGVGNSFSSTLLFIALASVAFIILLTFLVKKVKPDFYNKVAAKIKNLMIGIRDGIGSILRLEKRGLFIIYSILIWVLYYLMTYAVMKAFPETNQLGLVAALSVFTIGGIAMTLPLPGGIGSYHVLVPLGLSILYQIDQSEAKGFTFIFHSFLTLVTILAGFVSLIYAQIKIHRKNVNEVVEENTVRSE
ncbi:lysylphosphatidylglycerol synthase transmembrane domain-containing protein [Mangrovivirga sp. M17]|uniref:Lysylphosphatidylglycerol synthase transmembrane domain-containing protein n=1 Tax=Mangrovivirga halotolerans TaxID=2993936 RepID=A0ABT3RST3_9BACT|nr:lysylphosphatidylglycerol synthase transmembrane domain-containing protein [Mangrovivirga halotolerans]MCX2744845.1 lysylphosphatidylglycerol synthase transmembrane domain-containing protein [Mangrovivirga halotolerans]